MSTKSLSTEAYELIKADILHLRLKPADLLAQSDLAERYGVGLTPVRDALKILDREGLVQSIPSVGFLVVQLTFRDIKELFELREIAEVRAVGLAAARASKEKKQDLLKAANFTYVFGDDDSYVEYLLENAAFHSSIGDMSGNTRLADLIERLHDEMIRVYHIGLNTYDCTARLLEDHLSLADAIIDGNPEMAMEISREEILYAYERVRESLLGQMEIGAEGELEIGLPTREL
jgi:DNA-binding GntR family transcriptional regulator